MSEVEKASTSAPETAAALMEALNATDSNGTDALNATAKFVATPEGTALAYGSLVLMALVPIFFGALRSVACSKSKVRLSLAGTSSAHHRASSRPGKLSYIAIYDS